MLKYVKNIDRLGGTFLLLLTIVSISISPPSWAKVSLNKYNYSLKALVKVRSISSGTIDNYCDSTVRIYILFPSLKAVTVTKHFYTSRNSSGDLTESSKIDIIESAGPDYGALLYLLVPITGFWFLLKPSSNKEDAPGLKPAR